MIELILSDCSKLSCLFRNQGECTPTLTQDIQARVELANFVYDSCWC